MQEVDAMHLAELERRVALALGGSDFVLVVPPFAAKELPSIALHLLQACAARAGFEVGVFYASLAFASWIGEDYYESLSDS